MSRALTVERNATEYAYIDLEDDDLQAMHDDGVNLERGWEIVEWLQKHGATADLDWEADDVTSPDCNYWEGPGNFKPVIPEPGESKPRPIKPITGQLAIDGTEVQ